MSNPLGDMSLAEQFEMHMENKRIGEEEAKLWDEAYKHGQDDMRACAERAEAERDRLAEALRGVLEKSWYREDAPSFIRARAALASLERETGGTAEER